jgi:membrane associated rhomboid family serine protease
MGYWEGDDSYYDAPRRGGGTSVVRGLIIANVVIFIAQYLLVKNGTYGQVFGYFELSRSDVFGRGWVWQLVSYAFLHDPQNVMHILFNMLFLYWFGADIERMWGGKRFIWFYLAAAAFSGLCYLLVQAVMKEDNPCIGASGAIFSLVMAYRLYWPNRGILFMFFIPMRIKTFVWIVIALETYSTVFANASDRGGVANAAHLGGLLFGYLTLKFGPLVAGAISSRRRRGWEPDPSDERRRDEILDRISREGIGSLTWSDRRFLKKFRRE